MTNKLESPINGHRFMGNIEKFLRGKIREQDTAMRTIAFKLVSMRDKKSYGDSQPSNLHKLVFSGTSGCGKTETARWIKHLLGMDHGFEHERQYVEVSKERKDCASSSTTTTGDAICPDIDTLVDRLNTALESYDNVERGHPRFMMLLVDEIDYMDEAFLPNMNSLLRSGCLTKSDKKGSFQLPNETTLIIVFTCSYGEDGISKIPKPHNTNEAKLCIYEDMTARGMSESTAKQMGDLVPFYPLNTETIKVILMDRLEQFIKESSLCAQFGEITYHGNVKNLLIDKVINLTEQGRGIRQRLGKLLENIGEFFETALYELHERQTEHDTIRNTLVVTMREIDLKNFDEQMEREWEPFVNEVMRSIMNNPCVYSTIAEYRIREENADALSMYVNNNTNDHVASMLVAMDGGYVRQQNNVFNKCSGTSPAQVVMLKEKNQELVDTLGKVESLVNKNKNDPHFHQKVKAVVIKSKKNLSRYDDDHSYSSPLLLLNNRVEEMDADESGESSPHVTNNSCSSSETSTFEEEKARPTVIERILLKYGEKNPEELEDYSFSSEVDQDSEEDKRLERERNKRNDRRLFEKLMKRHRNRMRVCTICQIAKSTQSYNPRLYKSRVGKSAIISFRASCNMCRKKK